jgi:serine/threonine protein kinase
MKHENLEGVKMKSFNILKLLGEGAWAKVYEGVDERDSSQVAIKVIPKKMILDTPKLEELVETEIRVLQQCSNSNIIGLVDHF